MGGKHSGLNPFRSYNLLKTSASCEPSPQKYSQTRKSLQTIAGTSQTPPDAWRSMGPHVKCSLFLVSQCGGSACLAPGASQVAHAAGLGLSKRKGSNMCHEADSVLLNTSGLNPHQIFRTLSCGETAWERFKTLSALIYTFVYSMPERRMHTFNWTDLVIWFGG